MQPDHSPYSINQKVQFPLNQDNSSLYYLTPGDFLNGRIDERLKLRDEKLYQARLNRIETKMQPGYSPYSINQKVQFPLNQDNILFLVISRSAVANYNSVCTLNEKIFTGPLSLL